MVVEEEEDEKAARGVGRRPEGGQLQREGA